MPHPMFEKHLPTLRQAVAAVETRVSWSPFSENPATYGAGAIERGYEAFEAYRDASFYLDQPGVVGRVGSEQSPYGLALNVTYPQCNPESLILAARAAMQTWVKAGPEVRAGVCLEILARLNQSSMELAQAVMHTTGQPFPVAFQLSVVNAQDRGLEAVAAAFREMKQVPGQVLWERHQGKNSAARLEKRYTVVPRGIALTIASAVAPTWNSYPAIFASLATGNPVIVKPHPDVILPLALTVAVARQTIKDAGFDPNLISLLVDDASAPAAKLLALKPEISIIDYTGNAEFGDWIEENASQAMVFAQKSSVNCVVVDSIDDYKGMLRNLTLSLCLYSGQLCTAPRVIFVSREGIRTAEGVISHEQFGRDLTFAIGKLLEEPARAAEVLGVIRSTEVADRVDAARDLGEVLRDSSALANPQWPEARMQGPLLVKVALSDPATYGEERLGPILHLVETGTSAESLAAAERVARERGSLYLAVYSSNPHLQDLAEDIALRTGAVLSLNLTGAWLLSQSAAFSDFHGSGINPSSNCSFVDSAFVAGRFQVVSVRRHADPA